ncbi:MAG: lytic transglycosylase domain-containing protein [Rhizobiales bacterium]|nr:lytic transglycosylase domain-containing protein [Hyphomicrobiales bacterium]
MVALFVTPSTIALDQYRSPFRGDFERFRLESQPAETAYRAPSRGDFERFRLASLPRRPALAGPIDRLPGVIGNDAEITTASLPPELGVRRDVPVGEVCETIVAAAQSAGLPVGFFARLIYQESSFRQYLVSRAGAQGVAQFMPGTAAEVGLADPFNPLMALPASAQYLTTHIRYFGNLGLAAAAYNAGPKRVEDWLARRSRLPAETRNYVYKITGHQPEKWIEQKSLELPMNLPAYAPCEGVAGLSRFHGAKKIEARLEPPIAKIVDTAKVAAAKAAAKAAAARAAHARKRLLAKGKDQGKPNTDSAAEEKVASAAGN